MPADLQNDLQNDLQAGENPGFPGNRAFAPALLDPDMDIPAGMVGPDGKPAPKRFSVYRNNVVVSLMQALAETYPSVRKIIGEENFSTVARIFIASHPPSSPMMQAYGDLFPGFLQKFEPLQHSPFLADVANVEKYWIEAYHAADAPPLDIADLGGIGPERLMETRFTAHPATRIVTSWYTLYDLFSSRANNGETELSYEKCQSIQAVLVTRPNLVVEVNGLDYATAEFFNCVIEEHTLGESVEKAMQVEKNFDASSAITLMLTSGIMTAISTNQD